MIIHATVGDNGNRQNHSKLITMKKLILLSGFVSLLFSPAFSQQKNFFKPETNPWSLSIENDTTISNLMKDQIFPKFSYLILLRDSLLSSQDSEKFAYNSQGFGMQERRVIDDNMPCIEPRGNYPSLMIKPDTTIRYTLLIGKP